MGWRRVLTVGAAAVGGLFCLIGAVGFVSSVTGNAPDFFDGATNLLMNAVYLALGAGLLYSFVRKRSQTVWVNTLRTMSAVLLIGTGTTIYGNVDGNLEDRNWIALAALLFGIGVTAAAFAKRENQRRAADDQSVRA